jgi:steroid delta-isomerase-like uncharacterized protein
VNTVQRITLGATVVAAVAGLTVVGTTANAQTENSLPDTARVAVNERVVGSFIQDVLNGHHGDHAVRYLAPDMQWHGGTVGTVAGRDNVAGLMTTVVTSIPDLHAAVQDVFGQGNEVVVRLVVTGTQRGPLLGIPASGRAVSWNATDLFRLDGGQIVEEWAAEDFTAILNDTGTYKAPWIS